jgi:hypothetical protein
MRQPESDVQHEASGIGRGLAAVVKRTQSFLDAESRHP